VRAFRSIGHEPTDEIAAFLRAARARTPEAMRQAFKGHGLTPMNLVFGTAGSGRRASPAR
jgi:penicillin amidase